MSVVIVDEVWEKYRRDLAYRTKRIEEDINWNSLESLREKLTELQSLNFKASIVDRNQHLIITEDYENLIARINAAINGKELVITETNNLKSYLASTTQKLSASTYTNSADAYLRTIKAAYDNYVQGHPEGALTSAEEALHGLQTLRSDFNQLTYEYVTANAGDEQNGWPRLDLYRILDQHPEIANYFDITKQSAVKSNLSKVEDDLSKGQEYVTKLQQLHQLDGDIDVLLNDIISKVQQEINKATDAAKQDLATDTIDRIAAITGDINTFATISAKADSIKVDATYKMIMSMGENPKAAKPTKYNDFITAVNALQTSKTKLDELVKQLGVLLTELNRQNSLNQANIALANQISKVNDKLNTIGTMDATDYKSIKSLLKSIYDPTRFDSAVTLIETTYNNDRGLYDETANTTYDQQYVALRDSIDSLKERVNQRLDDTNGDKGPTVYSVKYWENQEIEVLNSINQQIRNEESKMLNYKRATQNFTIYLSSPFGIKARDNYITLESNSDYVPKATLNIDPAWANDGEISNAIHTYSTNYTAFMAQKAIYKQAVDSQFKIDTNVINAYNEAVKTYTGLFVGNGGYFNQATALLNGFDAKAINDLIVNISTTLSGNQPTIDKKYLDNIQSVQSDFVQLGNVKTTAAEVLSNLENRKKYIDLNNRLNNIYKSVDQLNVNKPNVADTSYSITDVNTLDNFIALLQNQYAALTNMSPTAYSSPFTDLKLDPELYEPMKQTFDSRYTSLGQELQDLNTLKTTVKNNADNYKGFLDTFTNNFNAIVADLKKAPQAILVSTGTIGTDSSINYADSQVYNLFTKDNVLTDSAIVSSKIDTAIDAIKNDYLAGKTFKPTDIHYLVRNDSMVKNVEIRYETLLNLLRNITNEVEKAKNTLLSTSTDPKAKLAFEYKGLVNNLKNVVSSYPLDKYQTWLKTYLNGNPEHVTLDYAETTVINYTDELKNINTLFNSIVDKINKLYIENKADLDSINTQADVKQAMNDFKTMTSTEGTTESSTGDLYLVQLNKLLDTTEVQGEDAITSYPQLDAYLKKAISDRKAALEELKDNLTAFNTSDETKVKLVTLEDLLSENDPEKIQALITSNINEKDAIINGDGNTNNNYGLAYYNKYMQDHPGLVVTSDITAIIDSMNKKVAELKLTIDLLTARQNSMALNTTIAHYVAAEETRATADNDAILSRQADDTFENLSVYKQQIQSRIDAYNLANQNFSVDSNIQKVEDIIKKLININPDSPTLSNENINNYNSGAKGVNIRAYMDAKAKSDQNLKRLQSILAQVNSSLNIIQSDSNTAYAAWKKMIEAEETNLKTAIATEASGDDPYITYPTGGEQE